MASGASSSPFSSSTDRWTYEVFLSFRGEDTRNNFTAHLYDALDRKGIKIFIDDKLRRGDNISPALITAIEESRISIVVFSQNYASSSWCLDELTKILECREIKGQMVMPVFYKVHPSEMRHQKNSVGEAFAKHEKRFKDDPEKVQRWRIAVRELSNLCGWHLGNNRNESQYIHTIVEEISRRVSRPHLNVARYPLGKLESRVNDIKLRLNLEMNDIRTVGIFGRGGIGKTTIAKAVYNSIADEFQGSSFLANVRETSKQSDGLVKLQQQLLSNILGKSSLKVGNVYEGINLIKQRLFSTKVLLIIDDVDELPQLEALCGGYDWFGLGSRIIITTRDEHLLTKHKVDATYKVGELDHDEALQLFSWYTFKRDHPIVDFVELTEQALCHAGGLPLALEVLGSSLMGRGLAEWRSALDRYKRIPHKAIQERLKLSYDGLEVTEKEIFLDIACFFKGERVDYVIKILDECGFFPYIGIKVLMDKSLITIDERNTLMMHDLLQEMGKEIVRQESPKYPGKRSRVWFHDDARRVLEENMGGEEVEGILVDLPEQDLHICLSSKAFKKMKNLRLFINRNACFSGGPDCLPNELRLIDWPQYPSQSLPSNFQGKKVVVFEMRNSLFKNIDAFKNFNKMTILEFSDCKFLTKIPDLSKNPNLQELILDRCTNLVEVHHSIGFLDKLVSLSISRCSKLRSLPRIFKLTSLIVLVLEGCLELQNFPEIGCEMECLRSIDLRHTAVKELPSSIEYLIRLEDLNLEGCKNLINLPSSIQLLQHLKNLSLKDCSKLSQFPLQPPVNLSIFNGGDSSIACLALRSLNLGNCILSKSYFFRNLNSFTLEELDLSGCDFVSTTCIKRFIGLRRLILVGCKKLEEIVGLPPDIEEVNAGGCISLERFPEVSKRFESNTCDLRGLVWVDLSRCHKLLENMENVVEKFSSVKGNIENYICSIIFPGNKIPSWFSHQKHTSNSGICQIDITEASRLDGEIIGMTLGAVIGIKDEPQIPLMILCDVEIINGLSRHYEAKKFHFSGSDHLWLQYHIPKFDELKGDNVRVKFQIWDSTGLAFFKSCGVHLVRRYEEKATNQMLNPQVQGVPLEDVEGNLEDYICSSVFPGNTIPNWFSHQKQTSNNNICEIDISEASCLHGEITGMALCAIIGLKDEPQIPLLISCTVRIINGYSRHFEANKIHLSGSDHAWLQYHIPKFDELKGDNVRVKFQIWDSTGLAFFKSCGVHLVRRYEEKAIDQMLNAPNEAIENAVDLMDGTQLKKRRRDDHLENNDCPPQKRQCGAFGIRISGTDSIQEHQSTSLNRPISKGKLLTEDKVRVKGPRLRSSFRGYHGVGIGLRFKMYRPRKRKIQKVISNCDDHLENNYCPRRKRQCGAFGINGK